MKHFTVGGVRTVTGGLILYDHYMATQGRSKRGFAAMDPERQREIASKGGRASGGNFARDPQRAAEAGRKGGRSREGR